MPHLDIFGLSESFLLRLSGHLHWQTLAALYRKPSRDWTDQEGRPIYASFIYSRVTYAGDHRGALDDVARAQCSIVGSQGLSLCTETRILIDAAEIATVTLLSAFARRQESGRNVLVRPDLRADTHLPNVHANTIRSVKERRAALKENGQCAGEIMNFTPSPNLDFNNAKFLYFVAYTEFLIRASACPERGALIREREIAYVGSIRPGERIDVCQAQAQTNQLIVKRSSDDALICVARIDCG